MSSVTLAFMARSLADRAGSSIRSTALISSPCSLNMLVNPLYAGYICSEVYELNWLRGHHQPLISLETYDKIQTRLHGSAYAPARKNIGDDFALCGFVTCGDCGKKLRSSWAKGKYKHYAYYLSSCQTKGCDSYGKSIPRARVEDAFGDVVRTLQPTPGLLQLAEMMFRDAWAARLDQMKDATKSVRRQIAEADKQIESLLDRIMSATNDAVISAYE